MNREKTGALIAAARKEKNMTQKDLAKVLHVSDRAVSKWERGAGFPDVSLLEPLADALDLQVLDLLRGEEQEEAEPEVTVRRALVLLVRQAREKTLRRWGQILGTLVALAMVVFVLFGILVRSGVFERPVSLTVTAAVYTPEGEMTGETAVTIDGTRTIWTLDGSDSFVGRFAIDAVEPTCREDVTAQIQWDAMGVEGWQDIQYHRPGEFCSLGVERMLYITEDLQSFGLKLEDGTIIATDPVYVPLLMSGYYYSIRSTFSNQF